MNDISITAEIKSQRLARGLSQGDIARLAGVPLRTYQRLESGDRGAKLDTLLRVLDALGLTMTTTAKHRPVLDELAALYGDE